MKRLAGCSAQLYYKMKSKHNYLIAAVFKNSVVNYFIIFLTIQFVLSACKASHHEQSATVIVPASSDSIRYVGRVKNAHDSVGIFWPGTSILIHFKGTALKAWLCDQRGENYFNVVIDGDSVHHFKTDASKKFYTLAENLSAGDHVIELIKRTEWDKGNSWFYGFWLNGELAKLPEPNSRIIEFFGDSITAGYAIEDNTGGDSPDSTFTNNYLTYASLTSRHFHADCYNTVKSGIGVTISWFPMVMKDLYDRLDPEDSLSKWDFSKVTPAVVVVNLFQNDSWLVKMPEHPSFKKQFGKKAPGEKEIVAAYYSLIRKIRTAYPHAYIICALGSMDATKPDSPWPGYVTTAVKQLNDKKVMTHFFPFTAMAGHPRIADNRQMADDLIHFISDHTEWK
jgi:hypothetical protein